MQNNKFRFKITRYCIIFKYFVFEIYIMRDTSQLDLESNHRFIQFNLWIDCPNKCKFCYAKYLEKSNKVKLLEETIDIINSPLMDKFNEIGFIGGELFGKQLTDPKVHQLFYKMMTIVKEKVDQGKIQKIYLATALMYKDTSELIECIEFFKQCGYEDRILVCTSYDTIYRFTTEAALRNWENNMKMLHEVYPRVGLHIETITTNDFITKVNNGEFDIVDFCNKHHARMDFIEPQCPLAGINKQQLIEMLPGFVPSRKEFIKFARYIMKEGILPPQDFMNYELMSDVLFQLDENDEYYLMWGRRKDPMRDISKFLEKLKREFKFAGYIDSDKVIQDDVKALRSMYI